MCKILPPCRPAAKVHFKLSHHYRPCPRPLPDTCSAPFNPHQHSGIRGGICDKFTEVKGLFKMKWVSVRHAEVKASCSKVTTRLTHTGGFFFHICGGKLPSGGADMAQLSLTAVYMRIQPGYTYKHWFFSPVNGQMYESKQILGLLRCVNSFF